jgi:hypothetical protein
VTGQAIPLPAPFYFVQRKEQTMYFVARTPKNPEFNGKVYGIQFNAGQAIISKETVSPFLGLTADEIARRLKADFGYEIEQVGGATLPAEAGEPPVQGTGVSKKK